jgi:hypothetical protein
VVAATAAAAASPPALLVPQPPPPPPPPFPRSTPTTLLRRTVPATDCTAREVTFDRHFMSTHRPQSASEDGAATGTAGAVTARRLEGMTLAELREAQRVALNTIGSSTKRAPPPSQLAASATLRQFAANLAQREATAARRRAADAEAAASGSDRFGPGGRMSDAEFCASLGAVDSAEQGRTIAPPDALVVIDRSHDGPPRKYIRAGQYLIADRRRGAWEALDEHFIAMSPLRAPPPLKGVADRGFALVRKAAAPPALRRRDADARSVVSQLTEATPA